MQILRGAEAFAYLEKYPDCSDLGWIDLNFEVRDEDREKGLHNNCTVKEAREWIASGKCDESMFYIDNALDYEEGKELLLRVFKDEFLNYGESIDLYSALDRDDDYINKSFAQECVDRMVEEGILLSERDGQETHYKIPISTLTPLEKLQALMAYSNEHRVYLETEKVMFILNSIEEDVDSGKLKEVAVE